jgi:hypothetical protein
MILSSYGLMSDARAPPRETCGDTQADGLERRFASLVAPIDFC